MEEEDGKWLNSQEVTKERKKRWWGCGRGVRVGGEGAGRFRVGGEGGGGLVEEWVG